MQSARFAPFALLCYALTFLTASARAQEVLFGVTFNEQLIRIDPTTGAGTLVGMLGFPAIDPIGISTFGGELYVLDQVNDQLIVVNPFTAATVRTIHVADPNGNVFSEGDFEIRSDGTGFYSEANHLFNRVNIQDGSTSLISSNIPSNIDGLAFSFAGTLYGLQDFGTLYTIDPNTGVSTQIGGSGASTLTGGLDFRSDGVLFAAMDRSLFRINTSTGARVFVGDIGFDSVSGITFMVIPEPDALGILGLCLAPHLTRRRQRAS